MRHGNIWTMFLLVCFPLLLYSSFSVHLLDPKLSVLYLGKLDLYLYLVPHNQQWSFPSSWLPVEWECFGQTRKTKVWRERKHCIVCLWFWCSVPSSTDAAVASASKSEHLQMQQFAYHKIEWIHLACTGLLFFFFLMLVLFDFFFLPIEVLSILRHI